MTYTVIHGFGRTYGRYVKYDRHLTIANTLLMPFTELKQTRRLQSYTGFIVMSVISSDFALKCLFLEGFFLLEQYMLVSIGKQGLAHLKLSTKIKLCLQNKA